MDVHSLSLNTHLVDKHLHIVCLSLQNERVNAFYISRSTEQLMVNKRGVITLELLSWCLAQLYMPAWTVTQVIYHLLNIRTLICSTCLVVTGPAIHADLGSYSSVTSLTIGMLALSVSLC